jgi:hypothetical protein
MSDDKRTYSRVPTRIVAHARRVDGTDVIPRMIQSPELPGAAGSERREEMTKAGVNEALVDFLFDLDTKLEQLVALLAKNELATAYPLALEVVDISGSGVTFECVEPLQTGSALELVMVLRLNPLRLAAAVGEVVRCEARERGHVCSLSFTRIRETDQEAIVQFVFQEERARIRSEKWG